MTTLEIDAETEIETGHINAAEGLMILTAIATVTALATATATAGQVTGEEVRADPADPVDRGNQLEAKARPRQRKIG